MKTLFAPLRFILWVFWDFSGLRFFWEKILPPIEISQRKRPPSTFILWVSGVLLAYLILFNIASQRFDNRIRLIKERQNAILLELSISDRSLQKSALSRVADVQNMLCPYRPEIHHPISVFRSVFWLSPDKHNPTVQALKKVIESWKGQLDSVDLEKAVLADANLNGAKLGDANLREADLAGADLMNADLRGADLSDANLTNAVLRGADFSKAIIEGANLQGVDLKVPDNIDVWKGTLLGRDPEWIKHSGADLLCTAKTLSGAKLDPEIEQQLKTDCPHILTPP
jgi:uncharacterized protein YjbI with pentapeptide repeats